MMPSVAPMRRASPARASLTVVQCVLLVLCRAAAVGAAAAGPRLPPGERARAALKVVTELDGACGAETRRRAAFYALHPERFWGDEPCRGVLDRLAADAAAGAGDSVVGLDVGANVGVTLRDVHRCCGGGGGARVEVVAFECNRLNLPILEGAAKEADFPVSIVARAASDVAGREVNFALPSGVDQDGAAFAAATPGNPFGAVAAAPPDGGAPFETVATTTVDAALAARAPAARVAFAKVDVEGHEAAVLRGMRATLPRTRALLVEVSDLARDAGPTPLRDLVEFLDDRGFDVYRVGADCLLPLWGDHYHPIYDKWRYWSNVLAVRRGCSFAADAWASADVSGLDPDLDAAWLGPSGDAS